MARTVVAIMAWVVLATAARADKPQSAAARAKVHFHQGAAYYHAEKYDEAIAEYRAAYALMPLPDLLFNLAQAFRLKHDLQSAVDHYHQFLATDPKGDAAEEARRQLVVVEAALHEEARLQAEREAAEKPTPVVVAPPAPAPPVVVATKPAPAPAKKRRGWVAGVVIGVVLVAGAAIGVGLALGLEKDPQASLGVIR